MTSVKDHYDKHLANIYSWMSGDFAEKEKEFLNFLNENKISPSLNQVALDMGAGHGIQSLALAKQGFKVTAVDFNKQLLEELRNNTKEKSVSIGEGDIQNVLQFKNIQPELILCWGDTLTHLENFNAIEKFIDDCYQILPMNGRLILSFRDYSETLNGDQRFIPVKNDHHRILTCFLEYLPTQVRVTDLLYEKTEKGWEQKISSYLKYRASESEIEDVLTSVGFKIISSSTFNRMVTFVSVK